LQACMTARELRPPQSRRPCQLMPASSFTNALVAGRGCGRKQAIVACSAPTAPHRARRFRPSARAGPAQLVVA
jgi:hypothetical protein